MKHTLQHAYRVLRDYERELVPFGAEAREDLARIRSRKHALIRGLFALRRPDLMSKYPRDPYWTTAKFNSTDAHGCPVKKGDRIFYYPASRSVLTGAAAEQAAAEFHAATMDEASYTGQNW